MVDFKPAKALLLGTVLCAGVLPLSGCSGGSKATTAEIAQDPTESENPDAPPQDNLKSSQVEL
jgi:hypothetical protein